MISYGWRKLKPDEIMAVKLERKKAYKNFMSTSLVALASITGYNLVIGTVSLLFYYVFSVYIGRFLLIFAAIAISAVILFVIITSLFKNIYINHVSNKIMAFDTTVRSLKYRKDRLILTAMLDTELGYKPVGFYVPDSLADSVFVCQNVTVIKMKNHYRIIDFQ